MPRWTNLQGISKMKLTKSQLQQIIKEELQQEYESGAARADREMYMKRMGQEVPVEIGKLQTMLYRSRVLLSSSIDFNVDEIRAQT